MQSIIMIVSGKLKTTEKGSIMSRVIEKLKKLEKKGLVKINYKLGSFEILTKAKQKIKDITMSIATSDPKTCLQMFKQMYGED